MDRIAEAKEALKKLIDTYNKFKDDKSFLSNESLICESLILPLIRNVLHCETSNPSEFRPQEQLFYLSVKLGLKKPQNFYLLEKN